MATAITSNDDGGGSAPGGAVKTLAGTYVVPVLYPAPVVPVQPGTPTGTGGAGGAPVYSPAPNQPLDCDGCADPPASSTPPDARAPLGAAPVLRAEPAEPCELCAWIRGWPWWVWLLLAVLLYSLWNNRRTA
jgi:hypothetical protein